jgi:hypothetical protein
MNGRPNYKVVLRDNVHSLMHHHWGGYAATRLSRESGVGVGTIGRINDAQTSVGIDVIEAIARVWGLEPWHLLIPNLDPGNPPVAQLTATEVQLYERLRQAVAALQ